LHPSAQFTVSAYTTSDHYSSHTFTIGRTHRLLHQDIYDCSLSTRAEILEWKCLSRGSKAIHFPTHRRLESTEGEVIVARVTQTAWELKALGISCAREAVYMRSARISKTNKLSNLIERFPCCVVAR
jgi:hypothetical protein